MATYQDVIAHLSQKVYRRGINYTLNAMEDAFATLGNPHRTLPPVIHIAGTNGKGSISAYIINALMENGLQVGGFSSPHLLSYCERMHINQQPIPEPEFVKWYSHVRQALEKFDDLTEFEVLTAMAWCYLSGKQPDVVVVETGLGGTLDTTNLCQPSVCVLTSIAKDHEAILGESIEKIATDKAGIIKQGVPVVTTSTQKESVLSIIKDIAATKNAVVHTVDPLKELPTGTRLKGEVQCMNMPVAEKTVEVFLEKTGHVFNANKIKRGLVGASLPGRFDERVINGRQVIIDGAHNPEAMMGLCETLKKEYPAQKWTVLLGFSHGKNVKEMMGHVSPIAESLWYCEFDPKVSVPYNHVKNICPAPIEPYELTRLPDLPGDGPSLITGSLYFIGSVLKTLK